MNQYIIKECPECGNEYNINSFKNDICVFCNDDKIVKVFEVTEGDYNDVWSKEIIKGNSKQMDSYCVSAFNDPNEIKDLGSDSIGYQSYFETENKDDELLVKHYIEAIEIEDYNEDSYGKIDIDLTENNKEIEE